MPQNAAPKTREWKKFLKIAIPVAAGLLAAAIVIGCYAAFVDGAASPKEAATKYLKASMVYDAGDMVRYASVYQKFMLGGRTGMKDGALKAYLEKAYAGADALYSDKKITFVIESVREYGADDSETEAVRALYTERGLEADFSAAAEVRVRVLVDGAALRTQTVTTVKEGARWYYVQGF